MIETLLEKPTQWLDASGPQAAFVINTRASLSRNFLDLPFPARCGDEELASSEQRSLALLRKLDEFSRGAYYPLGQLDPKEVQLLEERQLLRDRFSRRVQGRGIYVSNEQAVSALLNDADHLRLQVLASGVQLHETWEHLSAMDDRASAHAEFAYDERLGYLTSSLGLTGTALRVTVLCHLPGLSLTKRIHEIERLLIEDHFTLMGYLGALDQAHGDLYEITNQATLGWSEEEMLYHAQTLIDQIIEREREARRAFLSEGSRGIEDRVGRAIGVAREARLLSLDEALDLLSSLRLGVESGLLTGYSYRQLNEILVTTQQAHLDMAREGERDALTGNMERADHFRVSFS